jgi:predicted DNA-binding ribbon-helix-helix protein
VVAAHGATRLETYPIKLGGRWTTIRLEPEIMRALREIALALGIGLHDLCTEIAVARSGGSFTSSLRVFAVNYYRRLLGDPRAAGGDGYRVVRRTLTSGTAEIAPALTHLLRWWQARCPASGRVPAHHAIDPDLLKALDLDGMVHMVDASTDDPLNFRFRVFGGRVAETGGPDFTGYRLAEVPGAEYRAAAVEDYRAAAAMAVPRLQEIETSAGKSRRIYQRLIAPVSVWGRGVDCLLVAVRYKSAQRAGSGAPWAGR